jgi:ATP synthase protein I
VGKFKEFVEKTSYLSLGFEFAISVLLGWGIGYFIDKKLNSFPIFTVIWIALGFTAGARNLYRRLKKIAE